MIHRLKTMYQFDSYLDLFGTTNHSDVKVILKQWITILSVLFFTKYFKLHMMLAKAMMHYNHHDNNDKGQYYSCTPNVTIITT